MSNSNSDDDRASNSDGPSSKPSTSQRPKRSAPKPSFVETDSSGSEQDDAVKRAKMKVKRPRKAQKSDLSEDFLKNIDSKHAGQLNELEREKFIFEQMERAELDKRREEMRKSLMKNKSKRGGGKSKDDSDESNLEYVSSSESEGEIREPKRTAKKQHSTEDEDLDMGYHRPSEVNAKRVKKKAMNDLMSKRKEKKEAEEKRKEQEKNRNVLDIDEIFGGVGVKSSSSSSSSSSDSSDSGRSPSPEAKIEIETVEDLSLCKISRTNLARFIYLPFFNQLAIGCYVRVGIGFRIDPHGQTKSGQVPVYRIAEITDVVETSKKYTVENNITTDKALKLKHGVHQRVYRIEFISNHPFTNEEWIQWLRSMKSKNVPLPTIDQVRAKEREIKHYLNRNLDSSEIDYMVKQKQLFQEAPTNYAVKKSELMRSKIDAEEQGDLDKVKEIQSQIDKLDADTEQIEFERNRNLSHVAVINQKRRIEMKQTFLDPKNIGYDHIRQDDPFTRKSNRTRVVSGVSKRGKDAEKDPTIENSEEGSQIGDSQRSTTKMLAQANGGSSTSNAAKPFSVHTGIELDLDI